MRGVGTTWLVRVRKTMPKDGYERNEMCMSIVRRNESEVCAVSRVTATRAH